MPDRKKQVTARTALAQRGAEPSPPDVLARIPPGQTLVSHFPVLDLGIQPDISQAQWSLRVYGLVAHPVELDWAAFRQLPQITCVSDFHCVTRWSRLDMNWEGVRAADVLALAQPLPEACYVTLHSHDGYTTNVPLDALLQQDTLLAHSVLGAPLERAHGGPVRLVIPKRYAWKSAKWLKAIELHAEDRPGFWEVRGYHNDADPWREERYG